MIDNREPVCLIPDMTEIDAVLQDIRELLAEPVDLPLEIRECFLSFLNGGLKLLAVEEAAAPGTRELRIRLQFPDAFREFVAALRAGDIERAIQIHGGSLSVNPEDSKQ